MAELWKLLSERGRVNWFLLCQQHDVVPSEEDQRVIRIETKLEDIQEIDKLMREPGRGAWHE